jgi:hypothetical protein
MKKPAMESDLPPATCLLCGKLEETDSDELGCSCIPDTDEPLDGITLIRKFYIS